MKRKGSKLGMRKALSKYAVPPLVGSYNSAVSMVCGLRYSNVSKSDHSRFIARQKQLSDANIAYDTYAYSVVKAWWPWCQEQGWSRVSPKIFCGKKAWDRFRKLMNSTVRLDTSASDDWNARVHEEMRAAQFYISSQLIGRVISIDQSRKVMKSNMSQNIEVIAEVVSLFGKVYDGADISCYDDVIHLLEEKRSAKNILRN